MDSLVTPATSDALAIAQLDQRVVDYARLAKAPETRRAYRRCWQHFETWCGRAGMVALPAADATLARYVAHLADQGRRPSGIAQAIAAISQAHKTTGHESPRGKPVTAEAWKGVRRALGTAPDQKSPVLVEDLRRMLAAMAPPAAVITLRNRALLLLGFAGGFRRSELVGLDIADVTEARDGLRVHLRRSKTDQEGKGRRLGIPYGSAPQTCPVRAMRAWLDAGARLQGPLFVSVDKAERLGGRLGGGDVARIIKKACAAAGIRPETYAGHSLRSGLVTAAANSGKSPQDIMAQTGHTSVQVMMRYIRNSDLDLFDHNAASGIGL